MYGHDSEARKKITVRFECGLLLIQKGDYTGNDTVQNEYFAFVALLLNF